MKKMIATSVLAIAAFATSAQAETYGTLGYTQFGDDVGAITGRGGFDLHKFVALEGEGSIGVVDDGVKLDYAIGAFVVGKLPVTNDFTLLARLGYQTLQSSFEIAGNETEIDESAESYGVGVQYNFNDKDGIRFDYSLFNSDADNYSFSLGYVGRY